MSHHLIDRCSQMDSPVHRLDPRTKLVFSFCFVILLVSIPPQQLLTFVIFGGSLFWIAAFARIPLVPILQRTVLVLPFCCFAGLSLVFFHRGPSIQFWGVHLSTVGLWLFLALVFKAILGVFVMILLVATTPFSALLAGLRGLGCPTLLIDMLAITYRFLEVFITEIHRLRTAAIIRGYSPRWLPQAKIAGQMIGTVFVRSYERAERVYCAMKMRGYQGTYPSSPLSSWKGLEAFALCLVVMVFLAFRIVSR